MSVAALVLAYLGGRAWVASRGATNLLENEDGVTMSLPLDQMLGVANHLSITVDSDESFWVEIGRCEPTGYTVVEVVRVKGESLKRTFNALTWFCRMSETDEPD